MTQKKPCHVLVYKEGEIYVGTSSNFGGDGMLIIMNEPPLLGEKIKIKLQFPDMPNPMELTGEVVWTNPFGTGDVHVPKGCAVKFVDINPDDKTALDNLSYQYHQSGDPLKFFYS